MCQEHEIQFASATVFSRLGFLRTPILLEQPGIILGANVVPCTHGRDVFTLERKRSLEIQPKKHGMLEIPF
jgi:hypothetical protein